MQIYLEASDTHMHRVTFFPISDYTFTTQCLTDPPKSALLKEARAQILAYLAGRLRVFDLPLAPAKSPFVAAVYEATCRIDYAHTISYSGLGQCIDKPKAARAIGQALGANALAILIPCHRVIGKNGRLTGYNGSLKNKQVLLALEARHA